MSLAPAPLRNDALKSIGFMCLAATILPFLNTGAKFLVAEYPVIQIVWARYAGHLLFMVLVFGPRRGPRLFATRRPGTQLLRSLLLLASTACYFTSLRYISLPTAAAVNFTSPLIVTLLAIPLLGEQVGWRRWSAVLCGFAGALVIIRPGLGGVHVAASLVLVSSACYALYQLLTRRISGDDPPDTSVTYTAVVGTLVLSLALPLFWHAPAGLRDWLWFCSLGVIAGVGHFFVVKAFQWGAASVVSPFSYLQLVGAAILGYAVFGDLPDAWTWVGAGMIVASGIYVTYRERVRRRT